MTKVHIRLTPAINIPVSVPLTPWQERIAQDMQGGKHYNKRRDIENLLHARKLDRQLNQDINYDF